MNVLSGLCVLNTRTAEQGLILNQAIEAAGGQSIHLPALRIEKIDSWLQSLPALNDVSVAIFISSNAAHYFFRQINIRDWPTHIYVIAMGKGTASALGALGIHVNEIPSDADSEHLVELSILKNTHLGTTLIIKGEGGRTLIEETLIKRKINYINLAVYKRLLPSYSPQKIKAIWQENHIDIILFLSFEAMQNTFTLFGEEGYHWLCNKACVVISQRLANLAKQLGINNIIICSYDRLLTTLADFNQGRRNGRN